MRRSHGIAEPGRSFATVVVPTATAFALARPLAEYLPLFPIWPADRWDRAQIFWIALLGVGLGLLFATGVRRTVAR